MRNVPRLLWPATIAACGLLAACAGGGAGNSSGSMTLSITDAPVDGVSSVVVTFTGVELKPSNGPSFSVDFSSPKSIDLLAMQGGKVTDLFTNQSVPAGHYDWLRLKVKADSSPSGTSYDSYVMVTGSSSEYNLVVPSGAQTGLKLVRGFTVAQGSMTGFVIDFDLRKSLVAPTGQGGSYYLRPALRMMDQMQVGTLAGTVDLAALTAAQLPSGAAVTDCHPGLYLFTGGSATPDDYDGDPTDGADPIWFEPVANDGTTTSVPFSIPFVEAGQTYTVAATCNFDVDQTTPDANTGVIPNDYDPTATSGQLGYQTMSWSVVDNVVISAGSTTTIAVP